MKVIKPTKLGIITRCFEHERRFFLSLGVLELHRFGGALASEMDLWPFLAGELGPDGAPDAGMPKERGEFLVTGSAFAPAGEPRPACTVQVRVGGLEKELWVYGNRFWTADDSGGEAVTDAEPFATMPITWETAFGGPGFDRNPLGKGFAAVATDHGLLHPLPNVELPAQAIASPRDRPEPAALGPIDSTWPQRASKSGTYDAEWLEERAPGFAKDIDWSIFNLAPEDQQQEGPFRGDETFRVFGMHPENPWVEGRLPRLAARCFLHMRGGEAGAFREVPMQLTTVWLFPHAERYLLIHHGRQEVAEEDAADVLELVVAAERLGEPRPVEHYERVLAQRLDADRGALYALRDRDLLPALSPGEDEPDRTMEEMNALTATEGLLQKHHRRKQEREIEAARAFVATQGLDPDVHGPPPLPPERPAPDPDELPELIEKLELDAERMRKEAEERKGEIREAIRAQLAAEGLDADAILDDLDQPPAGPPRFSAQAELERLRTRFAERRAVGLPPDPLDEMVLDPDQPRKLAETEERVREGYRLMAHRQGAAPRLAGEEAAGPRAAALASLAERGGLARHDLTGCDLSGLDLRGIDLRGAWLENANLAGTNLQRADLSDAVLARADLTEADLSGANLRKANLGLAGLDGTRADGADLSEAILAGARLHGASFRKAVLASVRLEEAELHATDMSGATLSDAVFLKGDLRGLCLAGAELGGATFLEVDVRGVDFAAASLEGATFLAANGDGAVLSGARAANARFVQECTFAGADFSEADVQGANLRGTKLSGSDFAGARLARADLSECELVRADLSHANARDALFTKADLSGARLVRANLMNALLQRANLSGTDLGGANLFQADLARVRTDGDTVLEGANLKKARRHPRASSTEATPE